VLQKYIRRPSNIRQLLTILIIEAGIDEAEIRDIETRAQQKVDAATEEARKGAPATVDEIERQVWSDGSARWRN